jgi:uncharacterized delta-60 repeat protein
MAVLHFRFYDRLLFFLLASLIALISAAPAPAQVTGCAGTVDPSFNRTGISPVSQYSAIAMDGDKVIASFYYGLARFNEDGTVDPTFLASLSAFGQFPAATIVKDSQGRWIVGGRFYSANSQPRHGIARFFANGQLDAAFAPTSGPFDGAVFVNAVAEQLNGKLIVAGTGYRAEGRTFFVSRLNSDGSIDASFKFGGADNEISSAAIESDGGILISGYFASVGGQPRNQICRLLPDGAVDETFDPAREMYFVSGLKVLPDTKILAYSSKLPGVTVYSTNAPGTNSLVRLNKNGTLDSAFTAFTGGVADVAIQGDGKYLIAGRSSYGQPVLKRVLADGTDDPSFAADTGANSIALDSRERIIITGASIVNGLLRQGFARLLNDNDTCIPLLSFETNQFEIVESNVVLQIPVIRSGNTAVETSVKIWVDSDAAGEFVPLQTNLTFAAGVTRQNVSLPITANHKLEPTRSVTLSLYEPAQGAALGRERWSNIAILDASSLNVPGSLDRTFNADTAYSYGTAVLLIAPDQKIITRVESPNPHLLRLNADGAADGTFTDSVDADPGAVAVWNDKLYMSTAVGEGTNTLIRLLVNGSEDGTFTRPVFLSPTGYGYNWLSAIHVHADGKVLAAGWFTNVNGAAISRLARINADGSLDASFNVGELFIGDAGNIIAIHELDDGSYLIGGNFVVFKDYTRRALAHVSSSGALLDDYLLPTLPTFSLVNSLASLPGSRVLVGAAYSIGGNSTTAHILRFTKDGTLDESFQTEPRSGAFDQIIVEPSGKILALRRETGIERLNPDGTSDAAFYPPQLPWGYARMALDNTGNLYVHSYSGILRLRTGEYSGPGVFELGAAQTVYENEGSAKIKIHRGWSTQGQVNVRVKTRDGSAHAGEHYASVDLPVVFADGEAEKEIEVPLIDIPAIALTEVSFNVLLTVETPGASTTETGGATTVTIREGRSGFIITPGYPNQPDFLEGTQYWQGITIIRVGPPNGQASVEVVTDGGDATPGVDYEPISEKLYFMGDPSRWMDSTSVGLRVLDDPFSEAPETIRIVLRNPSAGMSLLDPSTNIFILRDNAEEFRFTRSTVEAIQNQKYARVFVEPIVIPGYARADTTVRFSYRTKAGTAVPGAEYLPQQGTITFEPGNPTPQQIPIPLLPNFIVGEPTTFDIEIAPLDAEIVITNPIAHVVLRHPTAVVPAGAVDTRFSLPATSYYSQVASTPDFLYALGVPSTNSYFSQVGRFRRDGTLDENFHTELMNWFESIYPLPSGGLLVVDSDHGVLARLDATGAMDNSFHSELPQLSSIGTVAIRPDGRILVSERLQFVSLSFVLQLLPDGSIDPTFNRVNVDQYSSYITDLHLQPDGHIIVGGYFTEIGGVVRTNLARLTAGGNVDLSFNPRTPDGSPIGGIVLLPDGKFFGTALAADTGVPNKEVYRFNAEGSLDASWQFPPSPGDWSNSSIAADDQGRLYLADNGKLVRYLADGSLDANFFCGQRVGNLIAIHDGMLVTGNPNEPSQPVSRLFIDPPIALREPEKLPDGRLAHTFNFPAGTAYIFEQTTDFTTWTELLSGTSPSNYVHFETDAPTATAVFYRVRAQ